MPFIKKFANYGTPITTYILNEMMCDALYHPLVNSNTIAS
jgi:hypothetical protein